MYKSISYGKHKSTCCVTAIQKWLQISQIQGGPIFRPLTKNSKIRSRRLTGHAVAVILKDALGSALRSQGWPEAEIKKHIAKFSCSFYPHGSLPLFSFPSSPWPYKDAVHSSMYRVQYDRVRHAMRFQMRRGSLACKHVRPSTSMLATCLHERSSNALLACMQNAPSRRRLYRRLERQ